jgi:hypothetical protein
VPEEFKTSELCFAAVKNNGLALKFVSPSLITEIFCQTAIQTYPDAVEFIPEQYKTPEMCQPAVVKERSTRVLPESPMTYESYLQEVNNYGLELKWVPDKFKTKELLFAAVRQNGLALKYVDVNLLTRDEYTSICKASMGLN